MALHTSFGSAKSEAVFSERQAETVADERIQDEKRVEGKPHTNFGSSKSTVIISERQAGKVTDEETEDEFKLRIKLTQARDATQRKEVEPGCTIKCILCRAKMRARACRRHIMKRFCDACWNSNRTRCRHTLRRIRDLGKYKQTVDNYKHTDDKANTMARGPKTRQSTAQRHPRLDHGPRTSPPGL